jgi:hypothetical protein
MSWADQVERANQAFLETWGIEAAWQPQAGGDPVTITGIIKNPGMADEFIPGSSQGVGVVRFWVDFDSVDPAPAKGDQITLNGVSYDVSDLDVDIEGGAVLKLRRRNA